MAIKRLFSPIRSDDRLEYTHIGDKVTVKHLAYVPPHFDPESGSIIESDPIATSQTFDFTSIPNDGTEKVSTIQSTLPVNPFISLKRVSGVLEMVVINFIGADATDEERFPVWETINS